MPKITVTGPGGTGEYDGTYDQMTKTITTTMGEKIHLGQDDRVAVKAGCVVLIAAAVGIPGAALGVIHLLC